MKLLPYILLLLLAYTNKSLKFSRLRKAQAKTSIEEMAKVAHVMAYSKPSDADSEKDLLTDFKIIEVGSFKCSYGLLKSNNAIAVVAFRGTELLKPKTILADIVYFQVEVKKIKGLSCPGCKIHYGFNWAYGHLSDRINKELLPWLLDNIKEKKITEVYFTGHSLGGALATIGCYNLSTFLTEVKLGIITFGAPRVGNIEFRNVFNKLNLTVNIRVTYDNDPIPTVPLKSDHYMHCGTEYNFNSHFVYEYITDFNKDKTKSADTIVKTLKEFSNIKDHFQYKRIPSNLIKKIIEENKREINEAKIIGTL